MLDARRGLVYRETRFVVSDQLQGYRTCAERRLCFSAWQYWRLRRRSPQPTRPSAYRSMPRCGASSDAAIRRLTCFTYPAGRASSKPAAATRRATPGRRWIGKGRTTCSTVRNACVTTPRRKRPMSRSASGPRRRSTWSFPALARSSSLRSPAITTGERPLTRSRWTTGAFVRQPIPAPRGKGPTTTGPTSTRRRWRSAGRMACPSRSRSIPARPVRSPSGRLSRPSSIGAIGVGSRRSTPRPIPVAPRRTRSAATAARFSVAGTSCSPG